mgnify:CR=1 FL=1
MNSGADSMSLTSSVWYYERGDKNGQAASYSYPTSDLPCAKYASQEMQMAMETSTGMMELLHSEIS